MNRLQALRLEVLARRRDYLTRQLTQRGPDAPSRPWLQKEIDALDWVLRVIDSVHEADLLERFEESVS
jgi:hypothetical protein